MISKINRILRKEVTTDGTAPDKLKQEISLKRKYGVDIEHCLLQELNKVLEKLFDR